MEQCANDLHMAQLMPLPPTISCFIKIQIGLTFLVLAYPGSPGKEARICANISYFICSTSGHTCIDVFIAGK